MKKILGISILFFVSTSLSAASKSLDQVTVKMWLLSLCQLHNPLYRYEAKDDWRKRERYEQEVKVGDFARYGLQLFFDQEESKHSLTLNYVKHQSLEYVGIRHFLQDHSKDNKQDPFMYFIEPAGHAILIQKEHFEQRIKKYTTALLKSASSKATEQLLQNRCALLLDSTSDQSDKS